MSYRPHQLCKSSKMSPASTCSIALYKVYYNIVCRALIRQCYNDIKSKVINSKQHGTNALVLLSYTSAIHMLAKIFSLDQRLLPSIEVRITWCNALCLTGYALNTSVVMLSNIRNYSGYRGITILSLHKDYFASELFAF